MRYPALGDVLVLHRGILAESGGEPGLGLDFDLEHALEVRTRLRDDFPLEHRARVLEIVIVEITAVVLGGR